MAKDSRTHHADEFGKGTSGGIRGLDAPMIGAPTSVLLDGIVERQSGVTPGPWSVSVNGIIVFLVGMLLVGLALAWAGLTIRHAMLNPHHVAAPAQRVTTYDPASDRVWTR